MTPDQRIQAGFKPRMIFGRHFAIEPVFFQLKELVLKRVEYSIACRCGR